MLVPREFLDVARSLADADGLSAPLDAQIRRAVSTAYYALFHATLTAAAARFMGAENTGRPGYAILYRAFEHGRMKRLCDDINKPIMKESVQKQLGSSTIDANLRAFAMAFVYLQRLRHQADYDPHSIILHADAIHSVRIAEEAIEALDRASADERSDFLALLLANVRS